jgi:serine/threonine protein kinase
MQAPEVLEGQRASAASDVYAFALVMFELLAWDVPWRLPPLTVSGSPGWRLARQLHGPLLQPGCGRCQGGGPLAGNPSLRLDAPLCPW